MFENNYSLLTSNTAAAVVFILSSFLFFDMGMDFYKFNFNEPEVIETSGFAYYNNVQIKYVNRKYIKLYKNRFQENFIRVEFNTYVTKKEDSLLRRLRGKCVNVVYIKDDRNSGEAINIEECTGNKILTRNLVDQLNNTSFSVFQWILFILSFVVMAGSLVHMGLNKGNKIAKSDY
jgi:hypothetical protein